MRCPYCDNDSTNVLDSRLLKKDGTRVRKRECAACGQTFQTEENVRSAMPRVVKRDEERESFNLDKLRKGVELALHKRPVPSDTVDELISQVVHGIRKKGRNEVKSSEIGDAVMFHLGSVDSVAYIRFASVYQNFGNAEQFGELARVVHRSILPGAASYQRTLPLGFVADNNDEDEQEQGDS